MNSQMTKSGAAEKCKTHGRYTVRCLDKNGKEKWSSVIHNIICTEGKNLVLDVVFTPFGSVGRPLSHRMGLVSATGYTAIAAEDTVAGIGTTNGWDEATGLQLPDSDRRPVIWLAAAAGFKETATSSFAITASGTVKGIFMVLGDSALGQTGDTDGALWSVGLFGDGNKTVVNGDYIEGAYAVQL